MKSRWDFIYRCRMCTKEWKREVAYLGDIPQSHAMVALDSNTEIRLMAHACNETQVGLGDVIGAVPKSDS